MKLLFVLLVLFVSCENNNSTYEKILTRWVGLQSITNINSKIKQDNPISNPKATIQYLFAIAFFDRSFKTNYDCVYYKIPLNDEFGKLIIQKNYADSMCPEYPIKEYLLLSLSIKDLSFNLKENNTILKVNYKNQNNHSEEVVFRKMPLKIASSVSEMLSKKTMILKDNEICENVTDDCKVTRSNCDRCQNSFYPVINSACKTKYSKICGKNICGTKGSPACIRGYAASKYNLDYCINDSPVGFCEGDLRVMCINNTLVCD